MSRRVVQAGPYTATFALFVALSLGIIVMLLATLTFLPAILTASTAPTSNLERSKCFLWIGLSVGLLLEAALPILLIKGLILDVAPRHQGAFLPGGTRPDHVYGEGLHVDIRFLLPGEFVDYAVTESMSQTPTFECTSGDNVRVTVDASVTSRIVDVVEFRFEAPENYEELLKKRLMEVARQEVRQLPMKMVLDSSEMLSTNVCSTLEKEFIRFGLVVCRVLLVSLAVRPDIAQTLELQQVYQKIDELRAQGMSIEDAINFVQSERGKLSREIKEYILKMRR